MLEEITQDFAAYFDLDVSSGFQTVKDVVDNMLTRLEELTSVLQMMKLKNNDCSLAVREDISRYRSEITTLSKKVAAVNEIKYKLQSYVDILEKQVEKAEVDFGINNENKIKTFLIPFLLRNKISSVEANRPVTAPNKIKFDSVLNNFEDNQVEDK